MCFTVMSTLAEDLQGCYDKKHFKHLMWKEDMIFFSIVSSDPFVKVKRNQLRGDGCPKSAPLQGTIQGKDDDLYCAIYCQIVFCN